ncbi:MAG: 50S ribosomal protein L18 [Candidatus Atribacteria bacterium]|jgi:large subunit ribosomal protein L18|nr:50S ribosomal protein L18 [Candidatus Atribacteria bacterium]
MKDRKANARLRRKRSIRKKIHGTKEKPRLTVFRSANNIYIQAVDDEAGHTIASLSTLNAEVKKEVHYGGNIKAAETIGRMFNDILKEKGIKAIVFDRNGYLFHGRVKALADEIKL